MDPWYLLIRLMAVARQMGAALAEAEKQGYVFAPTSLKGAWVQRLDYTDQCVTAHVEGADTPSRTPSGPHTGPPSKTDPKPPRQRRPRSK